MNRTALLDWLERSDDWDEMDFRYTPEEYAADVVVLTDEEIQAETDEYEQDILDRLYWAGGLW